MDDWIGIMIGLGFGIILFGGGYLVVRRLLQKKAISIERPAVPQELPDIKPNPGPVEPMELPDSEIELLQKQLDELKKKKEAEKKKQKEDSGVEVVAKLGIEREKGYLYYIDHEGDVCRTKMRKGRGK